MAEREYSQRRELHKYRLVELVGLAGSGKTTIINALQQENQQYLVGDELELKKGAHLPIFLSDFPRLIPDLWRISNGSRWFNWDEIKALVYLHQAEKIYTRQTDRTDTVFLLDHGPIFKMAKLHAFGPDSLKDKEFSAWWQQLCEQWASLLDFVILLDAPLDTLKERIDSRQQRHAVKDKGEAEVHQFLLNYRESYEFILNKIQEENGPNSLRFDTSRSPVDQVVSEISTACRQLSLVS